MRRGEAGISLAEILVAVFLISIALVAMLELYPGTLARNVESELDMRLSAVAVRKMEEMILLLRAGGAGPAKTFYLHSEVSALANNWLAKDGVVPELGENASTKHSTGTVNTFKWFRPGSTTTATGTPGSTPAGRGWWSNAALNTTFTAGTWTFDVRRKGTAGTTASVRFHVRVYRVPQNTSIAGAVELFNTTGPTFTTPSDAPVTNNWTTASVGPFTLTNEYLLLEYWLESLASWTSVEFLFVVEGSTTTEANRPKVITSPTGGSAPTSGSATCTDLPNCLLVWTIATELSSAVPGTLKTLNVVACQDTNGNSACDSGERQVRYDAKVTSRP